MNVSRVERLSVWEHISQLHSYESMSEVDVVAQVGGAVYMGHMSALRKGFMLEPHSGCCYMNISGSHAVT